MRINLRPVTAPIFTHEGAPAARITPLAQLRRAVLACLLWEDQFYESGKSIADRITDLAAQVTTEELAALAVEARSEQHLRHVPLLLLVELSKRGGPIVGETMARVIQRADELAEFLAIYWKDGRKPLAAQVKKGLARAFAKFDAYQLAKWNRDNAVKLRDVLFMVHAKPKDEAQAETWRKLVDGTLESPDTWEVALSGGADKRETFERLIRDGKLGYLALLRNLRNMAEAGCDRDLVTGAILARKGAHNVLPFRFVAAARAAPSFEPAIDKALIATVRETGRLPGRTIVLVDVSGSMDMKLSEKSDMARIDAACALACVIDGDIRVFSFSDRTVEVPHRLGMAGVDAISRSQPHNGTYLGGALDQVNRIPHDRLIVITDEQSHDRVGKPVADKAYMINVAGYRNGVGYGNGWTHIDGWSEAVLRYIAESERAAD